MSAPARCAAVLAIVAIGFVLSPSSLAVAETILLPRPVPTFNQNYTNGPNAWGDCSLGTSGCPDRISTTGCLVTAFSSVLAYYEIELEVSARYSCTGSARSGMDPGILNDWLRENEGFGRCAQDPYGNCCLVWERLPDRIELTEHANRSDSGLNPVASVVIDHALREGRPIVAGVHWDAFCRASSDQTENCHWVVLTGKIGETYTIVDPMNPDASDSGGVRTTLESGTRGRYIIDRFYVVAPSALGTDDGASTDGGTARSEDTAEGDLPGAGVALILLTLVAALAAIVILASSQ